MADKPPTSTPEIEQTVEVLKGAALRCEATLEVAQVVEPADVERFPVALDILDAERPDDAQHQIRGRNRRAVVSELERHALIVRGRLNPRVRGEKTG